jgi:hypothetical protein
MPFSVNWAGDITEEPFGVHTTFVGGGLLDKLDLIDLII